MIREAERTLYTLSTIYQKGVSDSDYDVIAIDNGSARPLGEARVRQFGSNFKYHFFETKSPSPACAVNFGARIASGQFISVIVDGARMVTPGLVATGLKALETFANPFVCALAWHLGPDVQNVTVEKGYDQTEEDRLLNSIDWRVDGYRLFEIAALAQSSHQGFLGGMPDECSWFSMRRKTFIKMGGFDERFRSPGGGLVNHEFLDRVKRCPSFCPVVLLGEGSFHQIHGGVATNVPRSQHPWPQFAGEYEGIFDKPREKAPFSEPFYFGRMPPSAARFVKPRNT